MAKPPDSYLNDVTQTTERRAEAALNAVLKKPRVYTPPPLWKKKKAEKAAEEAKAATPPPPPLPPVKETFLNEALKETPVLTHETDRQKLRLLVITRDSTITNAGTLSQLRMLQLSELFSEVHVIVLSMLGGSMREISRMSENVWVYPTNSKSWWRTVFDAGRIAREQLKFVDGFRADILIAEDPFESGVAAYLMSEKYDRPFQIHVSHDFYDPSFRYLEDFNDWRIVMAKLTLRQADCIRTRSPYLLERLTTDIKSLRKKTELLPTYYDLAAWRDAPLEMSLKDRYPSFRFIMLHVSSMTNETHTDSVIAAAATTLSEYPTAALVIVGDGPNHKKLEKQVMDLKLQDQIFFEPMVPDLSSHMKTANVFIHISEDAEEEPLLLQAAACGLPMIVSSFGVAGELFIDGVNALVCPNGDTDCVRQKITNIMNENSKRLQLATRARVTVFESVEQDYHTYLELYRDSIERCIVSGI